MTLKAYQTARAVAESPREAEYRMFGDVTGALMNAQTAGIKGKPLAEAIHWNRRMWNALAFDCLSDDNKLPKELRARIVSLSIWVNKYSSDVMHRGAALEPLIGVNRTVMQGLRPAA
jgi:flagellar protein FlaF